MFFLLLFPFSLLAIYFPWPFIYLSAFTCLGLSFKFTLVPQNFHQPFKTYHRVLVAFWLTISMWRLAIWWSAWKMNTSNPTKHFILAMWNKHSSPPPLPPKKNKNNYELCGPTKPHFTKLPHFGIIHTLKKTQPIETWKKNQPKFDTVYGVTSRFPPADLSISHDPPHSHRFIPGTRSPGAGGPPLSPDWGGGRDHIDKIRHAVVEHARRYGELGDCGILCVLERNWIW